MSNGNGGDGTSPVEVPQLTTTVFDIAPPDAPTDIPRLHLEQYFRDTFDIFRKWQMPSYIATLLSGIIVAMGAFVMLLSHAAVLIVQPFLPAFGGAAFQIIDDLRKTLDPQFARFAVAVLNEFLGTDFNVSHLPQGEDVGAHLARAEEIGLLFHRQLLSEFLQNTGITLDPASGTFSEPTGPQGAGEKITPISGVRAAARFSGLAINFGTATGIIGTIGGLVPFVHLDEIREIGEEVARNLGIGRLQRLALAPIVQILLAEPYKWFINEYARPKQFTAGDVVNPFSGSVMDSSLIWRDLAREGYSDDKIAALLELHRKRPTESDLLTLQEGGQLQYDQVLTQLKRMGYDDPGAVTKAEAQHIQAQRPYQDEIRTAVVTAYADGHITRDELQAIVSQLPLSQDEKDLILIAADYKRKVPNKHLTVAQLESAFEQGILDLAEFTDQLTTLGYSPDDQNTLLLLTLLKLNKTKEAAAAKAAKAAAAAAKKGGGTPPPATPTIP
jgi:hypothetical protein